VAATSLAAGLAVADVQAECMRADREETASGRLTIQHFSDADQWSGQAYILVLSRPACLIDPAFNDVPEAQNVQIAATNETVRDRLARWVGNTVVVRGSAFAAHTIHHRAPIVMEVSAISRVGERRSPQTPNRTRPHSTPR
jgi:hypothetical protein